MFILIDTYETLAPLDGWLRETFLPQLPQSTLVVLAGRRPPSPVWLVDPGWATLVRMVALGNLNPEESRAYLRRRQVPSEQHQAALAFTHGHPLALSLVAEVVSQRPGLRFQPEAAPDVLKVLLDQFREHLPGPAHRAALEACAVVRATTEALLAEMLAVPDVHELFEWLRELSFIEAGQLGLFPHDLARETLAADLRWRDPEGYAQLRRRAGAYYLRRLQQARGSEQLRALADFMFLHHDSPAIRPFMEWQERGEVFPDVARESDVPELVAMVAQYEGEESARLAAHWLARQLQRVVVFREARPSASVPVPLPGESAGRPTLAGFSCMLALHEASAEDLSADPGTQAVWQYVQAHAPLRPGEAALYRRFWMERDTYQDVSFVRTLSMIDLERQVLTTPGLGPVFAAFADPDFWAPLETYAGLSRIPEADFEVGGRRYGLFGMDMRLVPAIARWTLLAEKLTATDTAPHHVQGAMVPPSLASISQAEFAAAVRDALRNFAQPDALHGNPLLRSRLVMDRVGVGGSKADQITTLRALVQEAAEALQHSPRRVKWYRALYHTYLQPAPTQEKAAELVDVPISSFRRHLHRGIACVAEILWQWETSGVAK